MSEEKKDMSEKCGFKYFDYWKRANIDKTLPRDEWNRWFYSYCGQCKYMADICMFGEE